MRRVVHEAACLTVPVAFVSIPVVGMLWVSAPQLPPTAVSVARMTAALSAIATLTYLLLRRRSAVVASNALGLPLLVMGLFPAAHAAASTAGLSEAAFAWTYLPVCLLGGWIAWRCAAEATVMLHVVFSTVAIVLILFVAGLLYMVYLRPAPYAPAVRRAMDRLSSALPLPGAEVGWRPDVYDLLLDGMGRPDEVEREYGISLQEPLDGFRALGFEIAPDGRANYMQTQLSLASMLNVGYLDEVAKAEGTSHDRGPLRDLISQARVPGLFKRLGYHVEFISSGYLSSGAFEQADVCDCPQLWFADAEVGALSLSPLKVLADGVGSRAHFDRSLAIFEKFEQARGGGAPRYVFAHVPMPHPPFVADARGEYNHSDRLLSMGDGTFYGGTPEEYHAGYRAQAIFTLSRALRAVTHVLEDGARSGRDVIVVVHGDHGPRLGFDALKPTATAGQRALPILLAIRWPAGRRPATSPESLVNVYRVLFQQVFHVDLPPLPDRGYISPFDKPYVMIPVQ